MNWQEYENITKYLYEKLGCIDGVKVICHGNTCKIKGASGIDHQVDVLTSSIIDAKQRKTAIECKYQEANISKDPIMKLFCIMQDCDIDYGVVVAKNGFTDDAIRYARHTGIISLVELRKPKDKDWSGRARNMTSTINLIHPSIDKVEIYADFFNENERFVPQELTIEHPDGGKESLDNFLISQETPELDKFYTVDSFPDGTIITHDNNTCFSGRIIIKYHIIANNIEVSRTEYKGDDYVSLYMHMIFEGRHLHLDKYGHIKVLS